MRKLIHFIIPGILILIAAGVIIAILLSKRIPDNDSGVIGNTAGNLNSGGLFCETDGTVFFSNPYDDGHLYSMDPDCDNIKYLSHDRVSYINAAGKFVYYVKGNAESDDMTMMFRSDLFGVVRCRHDGSDSEVLASGYSTDLALSGSSLIYNTSDGTQSTTASIDIRGENMTTVSRHTYSTASVSDGKVYYSNNGDNHSIYELDVDNRSASLFLDGNTAMANLIGDYMYYIDLDNNNSLTRINLTTTEQDVLSPAGCSLYNVYNNIVYYYINSDSPALYRANTDGSDKTLIMEKSIASISCTSIYTFFQIADDETLYRIETNGEPNVQVFYIQPQ